MDSDVLLRTSDFFISTDQKLQEKRQLQSKTQVQQADFLITQQWMRIMVWKMSIFHIKLSMNADDENLSICFPERIAQIVLVYLNNLSRNIIEAHGIGMVSSSSPLYSPSKAITKIHLANETSRRSNITRRHASLYTMGLRTSASHESRAGRYGLPHRPDLSLIARKCKSANGNLIRKTFISRMGLLATTNVD